MASLPDIATATDLTKFMLGDEDAIVRQAQRAVRNYCQWHVWPVITETLKLDGDGGKVLMLPTLKIVELISVTTGGATVDLANIDDSEAGFLELSVGCWSPRAGKTRVELQHGYDDVPEDVVAVIVQTAARAADSPAGRTREQAGGVNVGFGLTGAGVSGGLALLAHEKELLDPYRVEL